MLIKREVIEKIGYFDEIFSPGYWEESDYCRRAYRVGYRSVCAKGAYIYIIMKRLASKGEITGQKS